jgi:hypothetical protein
MERLHYNLSKEEFSKRGKILLWIFAGLFFLAGVFILVEGIVLGHKSIPAIISLAPFGISLFVSAIASFASIKRGNLFFTVDDDNIEFRYGIFRPKNHLFKWIDINTLTMPRKQKKVKLSFNDGSSFIIDLSWLQKKKSSRIRKQIYYMAKNKNLIVNKVMNL